MHRISVITDKPVAYDSPDHIQPWGTANDNSVNEWFNRKLRVWLGTYRLSVLDLGCSGGGFVKSVIDRGGFAVGIEGSDLSKRQQRAEWATIPGNLFTADITEPFTVQQDSSRGKSNPVQFQIITAWEVMEHLQEGQLPNVAENIFRHLTPGGVFIASVSPKEEIINGVRLHQIVRPREWWIETFASLGFKHHPSIVEAFGETDWIRYGSNAEGSFHLVLSRIDETPLQVGRLGLLHQSRLDIELLDNAICAWHDLSIRGSRLQAAKHILFQMLPKSVREQRLAQRNAG